MNDVDEAAENHIDDMRTFKPRRDYYETALDQASEHGCRECLESAKGRIVDSVKVQKPIDKVTLFRYVRNCVTNDSHHVPPSSPLHRAGKTDTRNPF